MINDDIEKFSDRLTSASPQLQQESSFQFGKVEAKVQNGWKCINLKIILSIDIRYKFTDKEVYEDTYEHQGETK